MKSIHELLGLIVGIKITIFIIIFLAFSLLPFGTNFYYPNFIYPPGESISLETAYKTWDAQHYLYLSEKGYSKSNESNAFAPLFPFVIFLLTFLTRSSFWSGIILANVFSTIAFIFFYRLVTYLYSEKIAYRSLLFLVAFPTSFYFSLIYSESLFFLLIVLFFFCLYKKRLLVASLVAFLLPAARLIGIAIFLPFLSSYILEYHKHHFSDELSIIQKSLFQRKTFLLFSPLLGLIIVMLFFYLTTGSLFSQFTAQNNFVSHYSFISVFNPLSLVKAFFTYPLQIHGFTNSLLDRLFFILFLIFLFFSFKRISPVLFIYSLCFGLLPVLSGSFMSYMRYLLIVFPIFITLSHMSFEKKYHMATIVILFISIMLQSLFIVMQGLNYWVS